jgi:hypothetical protein
MFDEEESQERLRRIDTCQRQEGNGKATHGQVGKNSGTEPRYYDNFRTASKAPRPDLPQNELDRYLITLHRNQPAALEESIGDKGISR